MNYLVELKGNPDKLVPVKARAAQEWCASASKANLKWEYLYIPFHIIQQGGLQSIEQLAAACKPALIALVEEARSGQLALPLEEAKTKKDFDKFLQEIIRDAGVTSLPSEIEQQVNESVDALFYSIRTEKKSLSGAFLNLLAITEMYAIKILDRHLRPHIPQFEPDLSEYFNPFVQDEPGLDKNLLITTQRRLKNNLIYGRNAFRMGCLLFCIRYAQEGYGQRTGLWKDISIEFQPSEYKPLFNQLSQVNDFRNASVHGDEIISNPDSAKKMMSLVVGCLSEMVKLSR
jgi:type III restriction enzyme